MLINALCNYYNVLSRQGKLVKEGYSEVKVSYMIMLRPDGSVADVVRYTKKRENTDKKGNPVIVEEPRTVILPKRSEKPGIEGNLIEHRPLYIFGLGIDSDKKLTADMKADKAKKSHDAFVERNLEFIDGISSPIVDAYRNFINSWKPEDNLANAALNDIIKDYDKVGYCFALDGHPELLLNDDTALLQRYEQEYMSDTDDDLPRGMCSVTGAEDQPISNIHGVIRGIAAGQPSGTKLVCFNNPSDESYGKTQSANSNISVQAAKQYTAALNYLLASPSHHSYIDGMTIVYWSMSDSAESDDSLCGFFGSMFADKANADEVNNRLSDLMSKARSGLMSSVDLSEAGIEENTEFYIVCLTANSSRICQKFCCRNTVAGMFRCIAQHQLDMAHDGLNYPLGVRNIVAEMYSPKVSDKKPSYPIFASLFSAILNSSQYPNSLLDTIIRRCKTDGDARNDKGKLISLSVNPARVAIIKACLNRHSRLVNKKEEITMALNPENTSPAYLCGRLFALLEIAQRSAAESELNRTIKDAYFASACANPSVVFPRLMKLAQHHLSKASNGGYINSLIGEVMDKLEGGFPKTFGVEQQGQFIIGYYQQNKAFYTKKTD